MLLHNTEFKLGTLWTAKTSLIAIPMYQLLTIAIINWTWSVLHLKYYSRQATNVLLIVFKTTVIEKLCWNFSGLLYSVFHCIELLGSPSIFTQVYQYNYRCFISKPTFLMSNASYSSALENWNNTRTLQKQ